MLSWLLLQTTTDATPLHVGAARVSVVPAGSRTAALNNMRTPTSVMSSGVLLQSATIAKASSRQMTSRYIPM